MRVNQNLILFLLLFIPIIFFECTKKGIDEIKYNPDPDFIIAEEVADTISITDTVLTLNIVRFTPKFQYDSVIWEIDNGNFHTKREILSIRFVDEGTYTITMTGYSHSEGRVIKDKVVRTSHVVNREGGASYLGNFKGNIAGVESDTFTIKIFRLEQDLSSYPYNTHILSNLPKGCISQLPPDGITPLTTLYFGYKMFVTDAPKCFPAGKCIGNYNAGKISVNFFIRDTSQPFDPLTGTYPLSYKKFIGYKF